MGKSSKVLSLFFGLIIAVLIVAPVFAQETDEDTSTDTATVTSTPRRSIANIEDRIQRAEDRAAELEIRKAERAAEKEAKAEDRTEKKEARLSERRLQICESRSARISNRVNKVLDRGNTLNTGHSNIQDRVDAFYTEKLVANGYELEEEEYFNLIAAMNAGKTNVDSVLELAANSGPAIDCNSDDPMGQIDMFKEDLRGLIDANKEYRTSVHAFVSAVLALAKEAKADRAADVIEVEDPTPTIEGGV